MIYNNHHGWVLDNLGKARLATKSAASRAAVLLYYVTLYYIVLRLCDPRARVYCQTAAFTRIQSLHAAFDNRRLYCLIQAPVAGCCIPRACSLVAAFDGEVRRGKHHICVYIYGVGHSRESDHGITGTPDHGITR